MPNGLWLGLANWHNEIRKVHAYVVERPGFSSGTTELICTNELNQIVLPYISGFEKRLTVNVNSSQEPRLLQVEDERMSYTRVLRQKKCIPQNYEVMIKDTHGDEVGITIVKSRTLKEQDYLRLAVVVEWNKRMMNGREIDAIHFMSLEEAIFGK
jgi:hypothetical protein